MQKIFSFLYFRNEWKAHRPNSFHFSIVGRSVGCLLGWCGWWGDGIDKMSGRAQARVHKTIFFNFQRNICFLFEHWNMETLAYTPRDREQYLFPTFCHFCFDFRFFFFLFTFLNNFSQNRIIYTFIFIFNFTVFNFPNSFIPWFHYVPPNRCRASQFNRMNDSDVFNMAEVGVGVEDVAGGRESYLIRIMR